MVFFAIQSDTERYSPSSSSDPSCLTWTMSRKLSLSVHPVGCIECWPNRHSRKNRLPKGGFFCLRFSYRDGSKLDRKAPHAQPLGKATNSRQAGPRADNFAT